MYTAFLSFLLSMCMIFSGTGISFGALKDLPFENNINSYTSKGTLNISLTSEISDSIKKDMKPFNLQSLFNALNDFEASWENNILTKNNQTKASAVFTVSAPDISFSSSAYSKISEEKSVAYTVIPTVLKAYLPEKYEDCKYAFCEYNTKIDEKEYSKLYSSLITSVLKNENELTDYLKDNKDIFKKRNSEYTLTLDNEQLLDFSKALALTTCSTEETTEFLNFYIEYIKSAIKENNLQPSPVFDEEFFEYELSSADIYGARAYITEFFDSIKGCKLLGEKGLVLKIKTNNKNQITNVNLAVDLSVDMAKLCGYADTFNINAFITLNNDFTNINKLTTVSIPNFPDEECVKAADLASEYQREIDEAYNNDYDYDYDYDYGYGDYRDFLEEDSYIDNLVLPAPDGSITLIKDNYRVDLKNPLKVIDGVDYVSLRDFKDIYYMENISYIPETNTVEFELYGEKYSFVIGEREIKSEFYSTYLTSPTLNIDGKCYVPLKSFIYGILDGECYWNSDMRAIIIW